MSKIKTIHDLEFDNKNFNKGNEHGKELIKKSLKDHGAGRSILVDKNAKIIAGNKTTENFKELGFEKIKIIKAKPDELVVVQRDDIDLDTPKGRAMALADNKTSEANLEWDFEMMQEQLPAELLEEWEIQLPEEELEATEDDYTEPDDMQVDVVLGDLIEIGEHRLLCGDSTDSDQVAKLMNGEKADMVFTSPPYNGNTHLDVGNGGGTLYNDNKMDNKESSEYIDFLRSVIDNILLFTNGFIFWNVNYNANSRSEYLVHLTPYFKFLWETVVWKKTGMPIADGLTRNCEFIFVLKNGEIKHIGKHFQTNHNLWDVSNLNSQDKINGHRACYPVELPSKGIGMSSKEKDIVLDTFLGSGTTMVAAHQLKRKCFGMELDPKYCQVIIDRMVKLDEALIIKINGKEYNKTT